MHTHNNQPQMIEYLESIDKQLFLYLNEKHQDWLDPIMLIFSSYVTWTIAFVLCGVIIYLSQKNYKIAAVIYYAITVALSSILTNILKIIVKRPRPIHEKEWDGIIHNIEGYSEAYSFFSSHAATTFCIATFLFLILRLKKVYAVFIFSLGVSYSRIYLSKHYPLDVIVGMLFGILVACIGYKLFESYTLSKDRISANHSIK